MYKVQKKDGQLEDFDRSKIVNGVIKAGCTPEEAERVASEIESWLPTVAVDGAVKSTDLRVKGLEILRTVNPGVAATYESYQKPAEPVEVETPQGQ